jgi:hypothetical protein
MKRVFLAFAICAIATVSVRAQATFVVTNSANGVEYTGSPTNKRPAGVNTLLTIYGSFSPTSSGAVSMPNCDPANGFDGPDCTANGVQIRGLDAFGGFLGYGVISYASTTQINFFWKSHTNTDLTQNVQFQLLQQDPVTGNLGVTHTSNINPQNVERRNLQPFLSYTTLGGVSGGYLVGTLYGCVNIGIPCTGYTALKSLTDGTANPREYNGFPTLLQIYLTGYNGQSVGPLPQEFPTLKLDNVFGFNSFQCYASGFGDGNYVGNLFWGTDTFSGPRWGGTGHQLLRIGYATLGASGTSFTYTQGPADSAGNRPGGLVYFQ